MDEQQTGIGFLHAPHQAIEQITHETASEESAQEAAPAAEEEAKATTLQTIKGEIEDLQKRVAALENLDRMLTKEDFQAFRQQLHDAGIRLDT